MTRLLHLSDMHFGAHDDGAVRALLSLAHELQPDLVVATGDLTQRATHAQFQAFRQFRARMPDARWVIVPGNHDLPWWPPQERLLSPYGRFLAATGQSAEEADVSCGAVRVLAVNTTRWWRHQYGVIDHGQLARVQAAAAAGDTAPWTLVACHHPLRLLPAPLNPRPDRNDLPWRHERALAAWGAAGVHGVLSGHVHIPALLSGAAGASGANRQPAAPSAPWCLQAGSATSWRLPPGQPNSVALLQLEPGGPGGRGFAYTRFDRPRSALDFAAAARSTWQDLDS